MNIVGFLGECNKAEHFCIKYICKDVDYIFKCTQEQRLIFETGFHRY